MRRRSLLAVPVLFIALVGGVTGCAGSVLEAPGTAREVLDRAPGSSATPSPAPSVVPFDDTYDPGRYGTGDPEADMGLISGEFVTGIQAVRAYAPTAYPEIYTGVGGGIPGNPDVLRIVLTTLDPAVEADLLTVSGMPAEKVLFQQGLLSEKEGLALQNRIMADAASGTLDAHRLGAVGPAADGVVEIQLVGHDPVQIQQLGDRYGPGIRIVIDATIAIAGDAPACAPDSIDPGFITGC